MMIIADALLTRLLLCRGLACQRVRNKPGGFAFGRVINYNQTWLMAPRTLRAIARSLLTRGWLAFFTITFIKTNTALYCRTIPSHT